MAKGKVEGFDDALRDMCAYNCGGCGEPPCWQLPDLTSDCDDSVITPCAECLAFVAKLEPTS